jgi:hypothetical protein
MTPSELEAALMQVFQQCEAEFCPLTDQQKQILGQAMHRQFAALPDATKSTREEPNPLEELIPEERQALLAFIKAEQIQDRSWKTSLLNDWIAGRNSGAVQFIRDRYGVQWLERVQPIHLAKYGSSERSDLMRLKVGDRIEVTNGLWEWVQEDGPCGREWFPCTVIQIQELDATDSNPAELQENEGVAPVVEEAGPTKNTSCIVRFDSGAEYEIQGVYDWNRPNWRWLKS